MQAYVAAYHLNELENAEGRIDDEDAV